MSTVQQAYRPMNGPPVQQHVMWVPPVRSISSQLMAYKVGMAIVLLAAGGAAALLAMSFNLPISGCDNVQPGMITNPAYPTATCLTCTDWSTSCVGWKIPTCDLDCYCWQSAPYPTIFGPESCGNLSTWQKLNQPISWVGIAALVSCIIALMIMCAGLRKRSRQLHDQQSNGDAVVYAPIGYTPSNAAVSYPQQQQQFIPNYPTASASPYSHQ
jgi:hypothetical protein